MSRFAVRLFALAALLPFMAACQGGAGAGAARAVTPSPAPAAPTATPAPLPAFTVNPDTDGLGFGWFYLNGTGAAPLELQQSGGAYYAAGSYQIRWTSANCTAFERIDGGAQANIGFDQAVGAQGARFNHRLTIAAGVHTYTVYADCLGDATPADMISKRYSVTF